MKELRILFTGAGRRIELITAFREAALERGYLLVIYGCDMSAEAPVLAFCNRVRGIVAMKDPAYIDELLAICKKDAIDLVIPTIDTDLLVLAENRERFLAQGTRVLISAADKIALCRDKNLTGDFFRDCGLKAPATVHDVNDYDGPFPAFIKPKDGSSSIDAHPVPDRESLLHYAKEVPDYVIQPCIRGGEYTIDICCDFDGHALGIVPRRRLLVRAGEVMKTRICMDARMIREAQAIIDAFHPAGPLTVQLIREEVTGDDYFIEINPRFGGGAPLSMKAGSDAAGRLLDCLVEDAADRMERARIADGAVYYRFDDSVQVVTGDAPRPLRGIIFDLDDTLYPEKQYVRSGYEAVAAYLGDPSLTEKMWQWFEEGLPAINHAIDEMVRPEEKEKCLEIYRTHAEGFSLYPGVTDLLRTLRDAGIKTGIITDGREVSQNIKIDALHLRDLVDDIIVTDALGGEQFRKPCDIAFRILQRKWRLPYAALAYVGDNLKKDFIAPVTLGMRAFYVENKDGLYYEKDETEMFAGITKLRQVMDIRIHCALPAADERAARSDADTALHGGDA